MKVMEKKECRKGKEIRRKRDNRKVAEDEKRWREEVCKSRI